jgi:uncharacterized alpha-E superfamily protein
VRDSEHPGALSFLSRALARDLTALTASLQTSSNAEADDMLEEGIPILSDAALVALESNTEEARRERQVLATRLRGVATAAGRLSDRLSLRHFAHISLDSQALAI